MPWVLLDVALAVVALAVLGMVGLGLFRRGRTLARAVGASTAALGDLTAGLQVTPPER
ncbi:MAG: hypothetical protein ACXVEJ_14875 [Nocardioides sp.]